MIKEARRRQRRRWIAVLATLVAVGLLALIIDSGGSTRHARTAASLHQALSGPSAIESPAVVFWRDPYIGVACHVANSIACDRVGLAVWLRRPARVTATIAGAPLKLNDPHWSYVSHSGQQTVYIYAGFLQPAGLTTRLHVNPESKTRTWLGNNAPSPFVRFRIDYGHRHVVFTQEHVLIEAGWG